MIDSPSATIVPRPTVVRYGFSCLTSMPKFDPVCSTVTGRSRAAQVVDDVGAVTEELGEELDVGHPRDRPVDPVVEAVQRIDLVRLDHEVEQARDGAHDDEADDQRAEEEHQRTAIRASR